MGKELQQQKENLFRLVETWEKDNIELAYQIACGQPALYRAMRKRYMLLIRLHGGAFLKDLSQIEFVSYLSIRGDHVDAFEKYYPKNKKVWKAVAPKLPIKTLNAAYLDLKEVPEWVCDMTNIEVLNFDGNKIESLPDEIGNLKELRIFKFNSNKLVCLPDSICNLTKLEKLQLDFNKIERLPEEIGNLEKLEWICLESNKIKAFPHSLNRMKKLRWVSIEKTPLGRKYGIKSGRFMNVGSAIMQKIIFGEEEEKK